MPVKIRLQRKGRKKAPFYHIVVADARSPRDGRFIERIGSYNPMTRPATIELDRQKAFDWLMNGAQPTDTARAILRYKGVMYRKHLQRGVSKGALTLEQAEQMWEKWINEKEATIASRVALTVEETLQRHKAVSGAAKKVEAPVEDPVATEEVAVEEAVDSVEETVEAVEETLEAVEETVVTEEAPVEEAPVAEESSEESTEAEETPATEEPTEEAEETKE